MKRYNNLYSQICHPYNLYLALHNAKKGKLRYSEVQATLNDTGRYLSELHEILMSYSFHTAPYKMKMVYEPKEREIFILPFFPDRIVHHAVAQVLRPIWEPTFIYDCYSALPGKGLHAGYYRVRSFLNDAENTKYCLKYDVSKFYPSMVHDILLEKLRKKIKCRDTMDLLEDIIRSPGGTKNVPIGNYLSQYFSNIYLNDFDHWLKEKRRMRYYARYCDDGVILHSDKAFLTDLMSDIGEYFESELELTLNPKSRVTPVDVQGIDFLGYKIFRDYALLRKSSARKFKKKIRDIVKNTDDYSDETVLCSVMSYYGWLTHCNSYNLQRKYLFENEALLEIVGDAAYRSGVDDPLRKIMRQKGIF